LAEVVGALTQFVEQPRVLDGDDRLGGEAREQRDLLLVKESDFWTVDCDNANRLIVLEHWDGNNGANAPKLNSIDRSGMTLAIRIRGGKIGYLHGPLSFQSALKRSARCGLSCGPCLHLVKLRGHVIRSHKSNSAFLTKVNARAPKFAMEHGGRRRRVFCASLADVFDNRVPKSWRDDLFYLITETPELDWQILTKRPQNIAKMLPADWGDGYVNVWLGTTAEDAIHFRMRWQILSDIPAARRFVSYEPALAPLGAISISHAKCLPDWVICGGESGSRARLIHPAWVRHVRDQCRALGIAFLHQQWGTYRSNPLVQEDSLSVAEAERRDPRSNGQGGALLDGRLHRDFPGSRRLNHSDRDCRPFRNEA
jgi:protein gp37